MAKLVDACLSHLVTTYQHDQNPARYGSPNDPPTPLPEYGTAAFLQRLHAELSDVEDDDEDLQRSFTAPDPHRPGARLPSAASAGAGTGPAGGLGAAPRTTPADPHGTSVPPADPTAWAPTF